MTVTDGLTQARSSLLGEAWRIFRSCFYLCLSQPQTVCFGSFRPIKMSSKISLVVEKWNKAMSRMCHGLWASLECKRPSILMSWAHFISPPWSLPQPGQTSKRGRNVALPTLCDVIPNLPVALERSCLTLLLFFPSLVQFTKSIPQLLIKHPVGSTEFQLFYLRNCLVLDTKGSKRHKSTFWFLV